jgi:hypothetical protein
MKTDSQEYASKSIDLLDYSSFGVVRKKLKEHGFNPEWVYPSTQKSKKWMYIDHDTGKKTHFGFFGQEDYTKHKDSQRREAFRRRNAKWATAPKGSPSWFSWNILW